MLHSKKIVRAPDGDEAFDEGSYIRQFAVLHSVRLIAFKCSRGVLHDPVTVRDISLAADDFYDILRNWRAASQSEWASMRKEPESGSRE